MDSQKIQFSFIFLIWASLITLCASSYNDLILSDQYSILGNDHHELDSFPSKEQVVELFRQWKEKHQRVYRLPGEAERRFENFKRNLKYVLEKNRMKKSANSHRLGLNGFADMSNEEFRKVYLSSVKRPMGKRTSPTRRRLQSCVAPASLDWRKRGVVTGVKDQGNCGKF